MIVRRNIVVAVIVTFCLAAALFVVIPVSPTSMWPYNPWWDLNDDGKIDISDLARVSGAFGTTGQNISKAGLLYDSGWINVTWEMGQNCTITHGLNLSCTDLIVDARGRSQGWNMTYGGTSDDEAQALVQTTDGGYAIAGYILGVGDFWLVKTDAYGNAQWNRTYGGIHDDYAQALVQTSDGGYAIAGYTDSFGAGSGDAWLVKTDASGNTQWNKTYGGTNNDDAYALVQTGDGGYALAGFTDSFGAGNYDFWLVKADSAGNMTWNQTHGGTGDDYAQALVQTAEGGYALAGLTHSFGAGYNDFWLVKTDSAGNEDFESGLAWVDSSADTITLHRGAVDVYWNFVRVRLWKPRQTP